MKSFLVLLLINLDLIASGLGVGFLLHLTMPSVDRGMGLLIGVVAAGFSVHYLVRTLAFAEDLDQMRDEGDDLVPIRFYPLVPPRGRAGRKKRK